MRTSLSLFLTGALAAGLAPFAPIGSAARAAVPVPPVTTLADGGPGSLRVAVLAANSDPDTTTITLGSGVYELDIAGFLDDIAVSGDLDVTQPLILEGAGRDVTVIDAESMGERAFDVLDSGKLTIRNLTIRKGSTNTVGGAINAQSGQRLTLEHVTLDSNNAVGYGGAVATDGPLTIGDSTFSGNASTGAGQIGGAIWFGSLGGTSIITASAFTGNSAAGNAGAIAGSGLPLVIQDSTFSANHAPAQSALWNEGGGLAGSNEWLLDHVTVTTNTAVSGGAVAVAGNGAMTLKDSIVAENKGGQCSSNKFTKIGTSVAGDISCGASSFNLYVLQGGESAGVYPLAANGGNSKTHALKFDSPALNLTTCDAGERDQRGVARPANIQRCDAGAYERAILPQDDPGQTAVTGLVAEIDVFANDRGTDGYTLGDPIAGGAATISVDAIHGHAAFASTHVVYTSEAGYIGPDTFRYTVCVAKECNQAQVHVQVSGSDPLPQPPNPGPSTTKESQYVAITPTRILDTRSTGTKPAAGSTTRVQITGVAGVPATDVTAAVLNITATEASAAGFVTVFPTGAAQPTASSLNLEYAGQTIPNLVTVAVGVDGSVSLFSQTGTHLVVDISGYYRRATDTKSGRFLPVAPTRLLDTRATNSPLGANTSIDLAVTGVAGVPTAASAVVLNVTATEAAAAGFVTVWPAGLDRPVVSNLNITRASQTIPNLVIVPVGADGNISIFSQSGTQIVVDITGWYTDASAEASYLGLFETFTPVRILDTRTGPKLSAGGSKPLPVLGTTNLSAVVLNITATEALGAGYVTAWPTGLPIPLVSSLNVEFAGQTIPNAAIIGVGPGNSIDLFSQSGTHLVVDLAGWFIVD